MLMLLSLPSTGTLEQLEACRAYFNNKEQYADAAVLAIQIPWNSLKFAEHTLIIRNNALMPLSMPSTNTSEQLEACRAYFNHKEQYTDAAVLAFQIPQNSLKLAEHTLIIRNNALMLLSLPSTDTSEQLEARRAPEKAEPQHIPGLNFKTGSRQRLSSPAPLAQSAPRPAPAANRPPPQPSPVVPGMSMPPPSSRLGPSAAFMSFGALPPRPLGQVSSLVLFFVYGCVGVHVNQ